MMKRTLLLFLFVLTAHGCSKNGFSDSDIKYVRASVDLTKMKGTIPSEADSNYYHPKVDSILQSYGWTEGSYKAYTDELVKNPDHTQLILLAIKDSLGLQR